MKTYDLALIPPRWQWPGDFLHRDVIIHAQTVLFRVYTLAPLDVREGFAATLQFVCSLLNDHVRLWECVCALRIVEKLLLSRRGLI